MPKNRITIWLRTVRASTSFIPTGGDINVSLVVLLVAPKVTNALTEIDWSSLTAEQIYNRYRALYGYKNLTTKFENKSLHLLDVRLPLGTQDKTTLMTTGQLWFQRSSNSLLVVCAENTILEIHKLRLEGRKAMTALEFNNGFLCKRKEKLKSKSHVFERK